MKISLRRPRLATLLLALAIPSDLPLRAQGSLTPPAAPAPGFKTLSQIEPRIDVATLAGDATAQILISAPGAYYLSGNVVGVSGRSGIAIAANNVSLDLNGFAITGVAGSLNGIEFRSSVLGCQLRNGTVASWGGGGIVGNPGSPAGLIVEGIVVNSCVSHGIRLGSSESVVVRRCYVRSVAGIGLQGGAVSDCRVEGVSGVTGTISTGISADSVLNCSVLNVVANASGARGIDAATVTGCAVSNLSNSSGGSVAVTGIVASTVTGCTVRTITGQGAPTGIDAQVVTGCTVSDLAGTGASGPYTGIKGRLVSQCFVTGLGLSTVAQPTTGISATSLISQCAVENLASAAALTGLSAGAAVLDSTVSFLTQAGGSANPCLGASAPTLRGCVVRGLHVDNSVGLIALKGDAVSDCSVQEITFTGNPALDVLAVDSTNQALVRNCRFIGPLRNGVRLLHGVVEGCSFDGITFALEVSANGRARVEHNRFRDCFSSILTSSSTSRALVTRNSFSNCTFEVGSGTTVNWQIGHLTSGPATLTTTTGAWDNFSND